MNAPAPSRDYRMLFAALCTLAGIYPLLDPGLRAGEWGVIAWTVTFWVVLYLSLRVLQVREITMKICRVCFGVAVAVGVGGILLHFDNPDSRMFEVLSVSADAVSFLLLGYVTVAILLDVLASGRVGANRIWGAVCVYLLIGLVWTFAYGLVSVVFDDCLVASERFKEALDNHQAAGLEMRLYFSFVTLTTVGYGDIAPGNPPMRLLATMEAVTGELYLAVLVARMVGLSISHARAHDEEDDR